MLREFPVTLNVTPRRIGELLVSALEGGSNYWMKIVDYKAPQNGVPKKSVLPYAKGVYRHIDFPLQGGAVVIEDTEEETPKRLYLDGAAIVLGLQKMAEKYPRHFANFISQNDDATTGDVFLQCCLLGEAVYG